MDTIETNTNQGFNLYSSVDYDCVSRTGSLHSLIVNSANNSPNVQRPSPLSVSNVTYTRSGDSSGVVGGIGQGLIDNDCNTYQHLPPSSYNSEYSTLSDVTSSTTANNIDIDEPLYREVYADTPYTTPSAGPKSEQSQGEGNYQPLNLVASSIYQ